MPGVMVVIPTNRRNTRRLAINKIHSIVLNRLKNSDEQFLVRWSGPSGAPPLSWHSIQELGRCLEDVQEYLEKRQKSLKTLPSRPLGLKKRKAPDSEMEIERRPSPVDRLLGQTKDSRPVSRASSVSSASSAALPSLDQIDVYNGVLDQDEHGFIYCRSPSKKDAAKNDIPQLDISNGLSAEMLHTAQRSKVDNALILIREEYLRRLRKVPGPQIHLVNTFDASTPSLRFRYISEYILREGVVKADPATQEGCQQCSPYMGRNIGCEYTRTCTCLEYAAVDESRITTAEQAATYERAKKTGSSTLGLPKKFPYYAEGTKIRRAGCLVPFYLHSRRPIYECNDRCACGPRCRNKNVQFGRTVELEIFKTSSSTGGRGWGLRCKTALHEGQFIDTYRGEIITDAEATRRETSSSSSKTKASYLYSLDKFAESEGLAPQDIYVVDGEFMGGPTKFMNHSCSPNCRQYTVSYNKHDCKVYDIAFFACRDIPAGEELTFDYLDKDEGEEGEEEPGEGAVPCLCGAEKCRKWLWT